MYRALGKFFDNLALFKPPRWWRRGMGAVGTYFWKKYEAKHE